MTDTSQPVPTPEEMPAEEHGNPHLAWLLALALIFIGVGGIVFLIGQNQNQNAFLDDTAGLGLMALGGNLAGSGTLAMFFWLAASGVVRGLRNSKPVAWGGQPFK